MKKRYPLCTLVDRSIRPVDHYVDHATLVGGIVMLVQIISWNIEVLITSRLHFGKSDTVIAHIELCVELADENVSKNPQRPCRWGNVHSHEAEYAKCLAKLTYLK